MNLFDLPDKRKTFYDDGVVLQIKSMGKFKIGVTDKVIVINAYGLVNNTNRGFTGAKTITLESITSIQYKSPGFTTGYLQLVTIGHDVSGGVDSAMKDENTITFLQKDEDIILQLKEYLESILVQRTNNTNYSSHSNLDELKKLKELLDMGIISQEEFDMKKKELLNL